VEQQKLAKDCRAAHGQGSQGACTVIPLPPARCLTQSGGSPWLQSTGSPRHSAAHLLQLCHRFRARGPTLPQGPGILNKGPSLPQGPGILNKGPSLPGAHPCQGPILATGFRARGQASLTRAHPCQGPGILNEGPSLPGAHPCHRDQASLPGAHGALARGHMGSITMQTCQLAHMGSSYGQLIWAASHCRTTRLLHGS